MKLYLGFICCLFFLISATIPGCELRTLGVYKPDLTKEEKEMLIEHSFYPPYIVRWPDKAVITVYDETNFPQLNEVLDEWNRCLKGIVTLIKTDNPRAKVKIVFEDLKKEASGRATIYYNTNYFITSGLIRIDKNYYGYDLDTYLHEFGHILGCGDHFLNGVMSAISDETQIDPDTCKYFKLLYSLPVGYLIQ